MDDRKKGPIQGGRSIWFLNRLLKEEGESFRNTSEGLDSLAQ